jgi:transposase
VDSADPSNSRVRAQSGDQTPPLERHHDEETCLFSKKLERGRFLWPSPAEGVVTITPAQLGYLLEGIDWRMPQKTWRPTVAG